MSNIRNNYLKVLEVINSLNIDSDSLNRIGRKPKMADIEVVALSLTAEFMSIDSENDLFRRLNNVGIPNLIERSQFNKRRRKLFDFSEAIRLVLASKFTELEDYFIVDSMPLEICKTARQNRVKICKERYETAPKKDSALLRTAGFTATSYMEYVPFPAFSIPLISPKRTYMIFTICKKSNINYLNVCCSETRDVCLLNSNWIFLSRQILFWRRR